MKYDVFEASKKLSRINLNLGRGMFELMSFWCRVVVGRREIPNTKAHTHSFFELQLCLEGTGCYVVNDKAITLNRGEYLLLPPHTKHKIISEKGDFKKLVWGFNIKDERCAMALRDERTGEEIYTADESIFYAIDVILENAFFGLYGYYDVIKGQLSYIFARLVRNCSSISDGVSFGKKPSLIIEDIQRYITDNLCLSPTTEEIAAQFSKSPGTIDKMCMEQCGMTVSEMKKQIQFEMIKKLLSETDCSMDEIAVQSGFADRYTFGKFFKRREGVPPGEFRRMLKR